MCQDAQQYKIACLKLPALFMKTSLSHAIGVRNFITCIREGYM